MAIRLTVHADTAPIRMNDHHGGPMATWTGSNTELEQRVQQLERRIEELANHLKTLAERTVALDDLRTEVGKLKFEVEEMREE
jgi:archaellum component FlaC